MCDLKKINYNKGNSNFFLLVSKICASLILLKGYLSQGVYVLRGKCPRGKCPGGKCPGGICPRGYMS